MAHLPFIDRLDAAAQLATALAPLRGKHPLVLGIPRGAVPMARAIAEALGGDLDVVLVRKLGAPGQPELAIGSVGEDGWTYLAEYAERTGADSEYVRHAIASERAAIRERRRRYTPERIPIDPAGRVVIVVDDGLATGATMIAALHAVRARHPARLICAVPVAAADSLARVRAYADDIVCLATPADFESVGQFYRRFDQVEDEAVVRCLAQRDSAHPSATAAARAVVVNASGLALDGDLVRPAGAYALVIFAHGSGSSRHSPRNRAVATALQCSGLATLLFDLLTRDEDRDAAMRFDIDLLAQRLDAAVAWAHAQNDLRELPLGLFGASTGAAAALETAASRPQRIAAVVSRGGRPDLASDAALVQVRAPTLLIVGGADPGVLQLNRIARAKLHCISEIAVIPGATHLFEEPGTLEAVQRRASEWFARWLAPSGVAQQQPDKR